MVDSADAHSIAEARVNGIREAANLLGAAALRAEKIEFLQKHEVGMQSGAKRRIIEACAGLLRKFADDVERIQNGGVPSAG